MIVNKLIFALGLILLIAIAINANRFVEEKADVPNSWNIDNDTEYWNDCRLGRKNTAEITYGFPGKRVTICAESWYEMDNGCLEVNDKTILCTGYVIEIL